LTWWEWLIVAVVYGPGGVFVFRKAFTLAIWDSLRNRCKSELGNPSYRSNATPRDADWITFVYGVWTGSLAWLVTPFWLLGISILATGKTIDYIFHPGQLTSFIAAEPRAARKARKELGT